MPVDYPNSLGRQVECLAFIEYRNLDAEQRAAIEDASRGQPGAGVRSAGTGRLGHAWGRPGEADHAISDVVGKDLWKAVRSTVPGIAYIDALRRGAEPVDARSGQDWLCGPHQSNLEQSRHSKE